MKDNNGISVIIPLYNRGVYVAEAIQSVIDQQLDRPCEIIVSDDGSTDDGIIIAKSFGHPVKVLKKPDSCRDQGVSGTRNRGIQIASQRYISFLDSDDLYLPGHLNCAISLLEANAEAGFVFSRTMEMREVDGQRILRPWTRAKVTTRDIDYPVLSRPHIVHTNSFVFKADVFKVVGLFNQSYKNGEDGDMWMRISEQYKGLFSDHYGAIYRIEHGSGQLTANNKSDVLASTFKVYQAAMDRYRECGVYDQYREFSLRQKLIGIDLISAHYESKLEHQLRYYYELCKLIPVYPKAFILKLYDFLLN